MKFHICDVSLLQGWCQTCGEYLQHATHPGSHVSLKRIFSVNQADWQKTFTEWTVVHLYWSMLINLVANILLIVWVPAFLMATIYRMCVFLIVGYIWSHMGWFAVVKQEGCLCFWFCCLTHGSVLILIQGILLWMWALSLLVNSISYFEWHIVGYLYSLIYVTYAVPLFYLGLACVMQWKQSPEKGCQTVTVEPQVAGTPNSAWA
eukprot:TRINITY_DN7263_c0_g1_i2.p1 TRINITY_DN7263_c0_g1~~TRINITY_DN7263_c0_g1_i2.p1  ORF type:complete len:205 (+),score=17.71 TRINITY_DN7263_c0_g1_i2:197-811(+)